MCSKCSHWKQKYNDDILDPEILVASLLGVSSLEELCIVGGEPLLYRNEILQVLEGIKETGIRTVIVTNGVQLDTCFINQIKDFNIHIVVSIDTLDRKFWKYVRGVDSYDVVMSNLTYALSVLEPCKISIQSVLSEETKEHVSNVARYAKSLNVYHSIQNYIQEGFEGEWTSITQESYSGYNTSNESCHAAGRNISIMPNGDVYTCFQQSWISGCEKPLGNLKNDNIKSLLSGDYVFNVLAEMKKCNKSCKVLKCNQE